MLEIGCGAGRFTEYLVANSKICCSVYISAAIYFNVALNKHNIVFLYDMDHFVTFYQI